MRHYLKNILQLLLSPVHGWEEVSRDGHVPEYIATHGLYPLIGLASVTYFIQGIYAVQFELVTLLQHALAVFMSLFLSFFIGKLGLETFTARYVDTGKLNVFKTDALAAYIIGILSVLQIVGNALPVHTVLVYLLLVFAVIVLWKSCRYLDIAVEKETYFTAMAIGVLIAPKILLDILFSLILG